MKSKFVKRPVKKVNFTRREIKPSFEISFIEKKFKDSVMESVNLRELHIKLQNGKQFADWIKNRIEQYGFVENEDFILVSLNSETKKSGRGGDRRSVDYFGSLNMAKELAMVENNAIGKIARRYFIERDKELSRQKTQVVDNPFNLVELGNDMGQVDVSIRLNQKLTRRRLMYVMARHLRCGRHWIQRLTNEIYKTLLDNPAATARNFRQHMNLPAISAEYLTRDQMEGHVQICVSGIEQSMLILFSANQNITFGELRSFAIEQAKLYHARLMAMVQRRPSELIFNHEYNIIPILPYRERRMQTV